MPLCLYTKQIRTSGGSTRIDRRSDCRRKHADALFGLEPSDVFFAADPVVGVGVDVVVVVAPRRPLILFFLSLTTQRDLSNGFVCVVTEEEEDKEEDKEDEEKRRRPKRRSPRPLDDWPSSPSSRRWSSFLERVFVVFVFVFFFFSKASSPLFVFQSVVVFREGPT